MLTVNTKYDILMYPEKWMEMNGETEAKILEM